MSSTFPADQVVGLARYNPKSFTDFAANIRFNPNGSIDARDGAGYRADYRFIYQPGHKYRFFLNVDLTAKRYSVDFREVTSGASYRLASNLAFRTEQQKVVSLGSWVGATSVQGTNVGFCDVIAHYDQY